MGLRDKLFGKKRDEGEKPDDAPRGREGGSAKGQADLLREIEAELAKQSQQGSGSQPNGKPQRESDLLPSREPQRESDPQPEPGVHSPADDRVVATEEDYFVEGTALECFYENEDITTVYVREGITEISELSFYNSYVWEVYLPSTVRIIDYSAFEGCMFLTTIDLPEGLQEIGEEAFQDCPKLEGVKLPGTLRVIGARAFQYCSQIEELVLPDSLEEIGEGAFSDCEKLDFIVVTSREVESLLRASGYTGIICATLEEGREAARKSWHAKMQEGAAARTQSSAQDDVIADLEKLLGQNGIVAPDDKAGKGSAGAAGSARKNSSSNKTADQGKPQTGEEIYKSSGSASYQEAYECFEMESGDIAAYKGHDSHVFIPAGVTGVKKGVFAEHTQIRDFEVHEANKELASIDGVLFKTASNREPRMLMAYPAQKASETYAVPCTEIARDAFYRARKLKAVDLSKVHVVGAGAFEGCSSLSVVVLSDDMGIVRKFAFKGCSSLKGIVLPAGVHQIDESAFSGCASLEAVKFPKALSYVKAEAFYGCKSLKQVQIFMRNGQDVIIGARAFRDCTALQVVDIQGGCKRIGHSAFRGCSSLEAVVLPEGIEVIEEGAFAFCTSLDMVVLPDSLKEIQPDAFLKCPGRKAVIKSKRVGEMLARSLGLLK